MESLPELPSLNFSEVSAQPLPPALSSIYLWDVCKHGKLFFRESYELCSVEKWNERFLSSLAHLVVLPPGFSGEKVTSMLLEKTRKNFNDSEFSKLLKGIDPKDFQSLTKLIERSSEKGKEAFEKLISDLKLEPFPPMLWIEVARYTSLYAAVTCFLTERVEQMFKLSPKHKSEALRRSKLAWVLSRQYDNLAKTFAEAFLNVIATLLFMETWSCKKEEELFTGKNWTLENVDPVVFEDMLFSLHMSLDELTRVFATLKEAKTQPSFSDPVGSAFKQLVQLA